MTSAHLCLCESRPPSLYPTPVVLQVALGLAKLRTGAGDRIVGQLVGIPAGSVSAFVRESWRWLAIALHEARALPPLSMSVLLHARRTFGATPSIASQAYRLPNCVGALDGWVTPFVCHGGERHEYWNYKHSVTSLNHLILWDGSPRPRVLYASLGFPGRRNDPGFMLDSELGRAIYMQEGPLVELVQALGAAEHQQVLEFTDQAGRLRRRNISPYIVTDAAFRLNEHVLTPFRCICIGGCSGSTG